MVRVRVRGDGEGEGEGERLEGRDKVMIEGEMNTIYYTV